MAETAKTAPVVNIGENSPEQIAYKLLATIAANEKKSLHGVTTTADRKWLLDNVCRMSMDGSEPRSPVHY